MKERSRESVIVKTSIIGILGNILLASFKAFVGVLTNSIAVTMDAVNNLSDAASSVITIVGAKLAGKKPDRKHPFGYGRIEYLSTMIIAVIVTYAGISSLIESVKSIINPELPSYTNVSIIIIAVAIPVKILMGFYVSKKGKEVNSDSLADSGKDALMDAVLSTATLVSALVYLFFDLSIEAYVAAGISLFIIKAGFEMISDTLSQILGERADREMVRELKNTVKSVEGVHGVFDLIINNYGPDAYMASLHVEVKDDLNANDIDKLSREITRQVYAKHGVIVTAVGIYSINTKDDVVVSAYRNVRKLAMSHDGVMQIHGFYADFEEKTMTLDVMIDFTVKDRVALYRHIYDDIREEYPDFTIHMVLDTDFSES
ncbi:MAG: cation diffusion facilitator family transporter [Sphaerochaetaceae bacterium]|nr:cation diffusion facilitator family transporter [Sphaerochaetaceae bacterium]